MAIDNAAYIADMNVNVPENADPIAEGAEQIQAVKRAVKNTFPNLTGPVTATADQINVAATQSNFIGEIKMYFGKLTDLPVGWNLCDGGIYNGVQTPDLKDTFPRAYNPNNDATAPIGTKGGSDTISLNGAVQGTKLTKAHLPKVETDMWSRRDNGENSGGEFYLTGVNTGGGSDRSKTIRTLTVDGGNQPHTHDITLDDIDNRPRFTILAFIMYTG